MVAWRETRWAIDVLDRQFEHRLELEHRLLEKKAAVGERTGSGSAPLLGEPERADFSSNSKKTKRRA